MSETPDLLTEAWTVINTLHGYLIEVRDLGLPADRAVTYAELAIDDLTAMHVLEPSGEPSDQSNPEGNS